MLFVRTIAIVADLAGVVVVAVMVTRLGTAVDDGDDGDDGADDGTADEDTRHRNADERWSEMAGHDRVVAVSRKYCNGIQRLRHLSCIDVFIVCCYQKK